MLTPQQILLIQETYMKMSLQLAFLGEKFYARLFEMHPELVPMFQNSMTSQAMKLMQTIGFAVSQIHSRETLRPVLEALGERHVYYGVKQEHYAYIGEALLLTLRDILGEDYTPDVHEAWAALYQELVETATQHLPHKQPSDGS